MLEKVNNNGVVIYSEETKNLLIQAIYNFSSVYASTARYDNYLYYRDNNFYMSLDGEPEIHIPSQSLRVVVLGVNGSTHGVYYDCKYTPDSKKPPTAIWLMDNPVAKQTLPPEIFEKDGEYNKYQIKLRIIVLLLDVPQAKGIPFIMDLTSSSFYGSLDSREQSSGSKFYAYLNKLRSKQLIPPMVNTIITPAVYTTKALKFSYQEDADKRCIVPSEEELKNRLALSLSTEVKEKLIIEEIIPQSDRLMETQPPVNFGQPIQQAPVGSETVNTFGEQQKTKKQQKPQKPQKPLNNLLGLINDAQDIKKKSDDNIVDSNDDGDDDWLDKLEEDSDGY